MLIALSLQGERLSSIGTYAIELKLLSDACCLFCPECNERVIFNGGPIRIHHFKHYRKSNCLNSNNESLEHLNAKIHIYEWAKGAYPQAKVELEYYIEETKQRSDVYVELISGEKFSFEIQMSQISAAEWQRRRSLFKRSNIKDIWLFGYRDSYMHLFDRKNSFLEYVNQKERIVYLIDSIEGNIFISGDLINEKRLWKFYEIPLSDLKITNIQSPCKYILSDENIIYKLVQDYFKNRKLRVKKILEKRKVIPNQESHKANKDTSSVSFTPINEEIEYITIPSPSVQYQESTTQKEKTSVQPMDKNHPYYSIHLKVLESKRAIGIDGDYSVLEAAEKEKGEEDKKRVRELQNITTITISDIDDVYSKLYPLRYRNKSIYHALDTLTKLRNKLKLVNPQISADDIQSYTDILFKFRFDLSL